MDDVERLRRSYANDIQRAQALSDAVATALEVVPRHIFLENSTAKPVTMEDAYSRKSFRLRSKDAQNPIYATPPASIARMIDLLDVQTGHAVLDIGTGTGYGAALIAHLVGNTGRVTTIDVERSLVEGANYAFDRIGFHWARAVQCDGINGLADLGPYDRILATAAVWQVPLPWHDQMRPDARMLIPLQVRANVQRVTELRRERCRNARLVGVFKDNITFTPIAGTLRTPSYFSEPCGISGLVINTEKPRDDDEVKSIFTLLTGSSCVLPTGIVVTMKELHDLLFWITLRERDFCLLREDGSFSNNLPSLLRFGNANVTYGFASRDSVSILSPPSDVVPCPFESRTQRQPFDLHVRYYGQSTELLNQLNDLIRSWDDADRPGDSRLSRVAFYFGGRHESPNTNTFTIPKLDATLSVDLVTSPRIAAFKVEVSDGNQEALTTFWKKVETDGSPIIEQIPHDTRHCLITFLWRGDARTQNVVLAGGLTGWDFSENRLTNVPGTDLWYRTYRVRTDLRTTYCYSINDPLKTFHSYSEYTERALGFSPDPFNRRVWAGPSRAREFHRHESVVDLCAPSGPDVEVPSNYVGRLAMHQIQSRILGNGRRVWVYRTVQDQSRVRDGDVSEPPVIVFLDGWTYLHLLGAPNTLDLLVQTHKISSCIGVFVDNPEEYRNRELGCNPLFNDFITMELLPWLTKHYDITGKREKRIIAGISLGALAAAYIGFQAPQCFGNVISQSGSYWWKPKGATNYEWLTEQFATEDHKAVRFYIEIGILESSTLGSEPSMLRSNRKFRDALCRKGYSVHYSEFSGGHEALNWRSTLPNALEKLFSALAGC